MILLWGSCRNTEYSPSTQTRQANRNMGSNSYCDTEFFLLNIYFLMQRNPDAVKDGKTHSKWRTKKQKHHSAGMCLHTQSTLVLVFVGSKLQEPPHSIGSSRIVENVGFHNVDHYVLWWTLEPFSHRDSALSPQLRLTFTPPVFVHTKPNEAWRYTSRSWHLNVFLFFFFNVFPPGSHLLI